MQIVINPEFERLIPPLSPEEFSQLEANILSEGIRDPLVVWRQNNTLLDGHNRYKVATTHGVDFDVHYLDFDDPEAAKDWMDKNQLGRRNLSPEQMSLLRGRRYNRVKKTKAEAGAMKGKSKGHNVPCLSSETIANEHGVSGKTIKRDGQFARAVEKVATTLGVNDLDVVNMYATKKDTLKAAAIIAEKPEAINDVLALTKEKKEQKRKQLEQAKQHKVETLKAEIKNAPIIHLQSCFTYLDTIADQSVDLIITDPPYLTEYKTENDFHSFVGQWLPKLINKAKPSGRIFICTGAYPDEMRVYLSFFKSCGWIVDAPLIWTYRNTLGQTPRMKYNLNYQLIWHLYTEQSISLDTSITNEMFSVQDIPAPDGRQGDRFHTWQKPDELANRLVRHASKPGDLVLDCFACTGTFLLAAAKAGRLAIGCEIDHANAEIAKQRGCEIKS